MSRHHKLAMNFVGNYEDIVLQAYFAYACEFVACPHASGRVVRISQNHYRCLRVGSLLLKVVEVNSVSAVLVYQFVA